MANLLVILAIVVLGLLLVGLGIGLSRRAQRRTREISEQLGIPMEPPPTPPPRLPRTPAAPGDAQPGDRGPSASTQTPTRPAPPARPRPGRPTPTRPEAPPPPQVPEAAPEPLTIPEAPPAPAAPPAPVPAPARVKPRLRDRLGRTRAAFSGFLTDLGGRTKIDDDVWDELEESLLLADVGIATTTRVLTDLRARAADLKVSDPADLVELLKAELVSVLEPADRELGLDGAAPRTAPDVWMFVGVNGVGKTTTIAKLAQQEVDAGRRVV
ncbi:MAG: signal recognition particle receptor subunit alpha, partial [Actinobacteria bacterium]|nr:signal recognition particle receptor subunit alpha [Actinomycetota bacterium]